MPRVGLSTDRVVEEAELMADEVGLTNFTLTTLAERLGVRQPSLYKHIDGMADLQRQIMLRAKIELADTLRRAAVGRSRGDAVVAISHAYRQWAHEHPGRYESVHRSPAPGDREDGEASWGVVQVCIDVMDGFKLHEDEAIDAIRAIRASIHGFVTLETGGGFSLPANIDRSFDRLVEGLVAAFTNWKHETPCSKARK
jgi:AcrR family transcriptional regulator